MLKTILLIGLSIIIIAVGYNYLVKFITKVIK